MTSSDLSRLISITARDEAERTATAYLLYNPPALDVVAVTLDACERLGLWRWAADETSPKPHWAPCGDPVSSVDVQQWNQSMAARFWQDSSDVMQLAPMPRGRPPDPAGYHGTALTSEPMPSQYSEMKDLVSAIAGWSDDQLLWCDYTRPDGVQGPLRGRYGMHLIDESARYSVNEHRSFCIVTRPGWGTVLQRVPDGPVAV